MTLSIIASLCMALGIFFTIAGYALTRTRRPIHDRLDTFLTGSGAEELTLKEIELIAAAQAAGDAQVTALENRANAVGPPRARLP